VTTNRHGPRPEEAQSSHALTGHATRASCEVTLEKRELKERCRQGGGDHRRYRINVTTAFWGLSR